MAPPTHDEMTAAESRKLEVFCTLCRANRPRRGYPLRSLEETARFRRQQRVRRVQAHLQKWRMFCIREMSMRSWKDPTDHRVPSSTEDTDTLAAMMEQLRTTTTSAGGGVQATTVPAPADQSSAGLGEMFEKMVVSSNSNSHGVSE